MKVIDVGCGPGIYVDSLSYLGLDATGVDIDPACPYEICDIFSQEYLDKFIEKKYKYDLALCLEVAEHIREEFADELIKRLTLTAPTIYFSAAKPGQGGYGHINCQEKKYWITKFNNHNFVLRQEKTDDLIQFIKQDIHMGWFVQNIMVFETYSKAYYKQIIESEKPQADKLAQYIKDNFS